MARKSRSKQRGPGVGTRSGTGGGGGSTGGGGGGGTGGGGGGSRGGSRGGGGRNNPGSNKKCKEEKLTPAPAPPAPAIRLQPEIKIIRKVLILAAENRKKLLEKELKRLQKNESKQA